jgi:hypothetical protein
MPMFCCKPFGIEAAQWTGEDPGLGGDLRAACRQRARRLQGGRGQGLDRDHRWTGSRAARDWIIKRAPEGSLPARRLRGELRTSVSGAGARAVYYSAQIVLLGAEFTHVRAVQRAGRRNSVICSRIHGPCHDARAARKAIGPTTPVPAPSNTLRGSAGKDRPIPS